MKNLGMIISCQANYINRSYPWLKIYGLQYGKRVAPVKSLLEGGVRTVMEAEVRVESGTGPSYFVYYLPYLTRKTREGQLVAPEEAINRVQVLKMSTSWASEYMMKEDRIGTLEKGKLADFLVLNKDFFTVPDAEVPSVFPLMTVVGGKVVVLREELAQDAGMKPVGPQIKFTTEPASDGGGEDREGM
jgi:predicted amidohydrolase YtcJ